MTSSPVLPEGRAMKTLSLKLPARLSARLERAAKKRGQSKSEIVRAAIEQFLNGVPLAPPATQTISALQLAGDLVGCVEGPGDLSTNPTYMEGFGE
jgi:predicted DNA-binding protein